MKTKKYIIFISILLILIVLAIPLKGYCSDIDGIITGMKDSGKATPGNKITEGINTIFSLIRYVGSGLSIIIVMCLGIKYMASSIEEKAEIKKRAIPVVIGCALLFATVNILNLIASVVDGVAGSGGTP